MLRRGLKVLHGRERGVQRVIVALLPVIMPDGEHAAHGKIRSALCEVIHLPAEIQQLYDVLIRLNGAVCGVTVDFVEVVYVRIGVIYVVKPVIAVQLRLDKLAFFEEGLLRLLVADNGGKGVEIVVIRF